MSYLPPPVGSIERCDAPTSCRNRPSRTNKLKPGAEAKSRKSAARAAGMSEDTKGVPPPKWPQGRRGRSCRLIFNASVSQNTASTPLSDFGKQQSQKSCAIWRASDGRLHPP